MIEISRQGTVHVLSCSTPLTADALDEIEGLVSPALADGQPRVVFNLENVPLIDSAGLEWLLDTLDLCTLRGGSMKLCQPNGLCREILHLTQVDRHFDLFDDPVAALGSFAQ